MAALTLGCGQNKDAKSSPSVRDSSQAVSTRNLSQGTSVVPGTARIVRVYQAPAPCTDGIGYKVIGPGVAPDNASSRACTIAICPADPGFTGYIALSPQANQSTIAPNKVVNIPVGADTITFCGDVARDNAGKAQGKINDFLAITATTPYAIVTWPLPLKPVN